MVAAAGRSKNLTFICVNICIRGKITERKVLFTSQIFKTLSNEYPPVDWTLDTELDDGAAGLDWVNCKVEPVWFDLWMQELGISDSVWPLIDTNIKLVPTHYIANFFSFLN